MNATDLLIWGVVIHLVVDFLGQNEWIAIHKAERRIPAERRGDGLMTPPRMYQPPTRWWDRHPAAYVHAGMHGAAQLLIFPWWAALAIGITHLLIDTRVPVVWWSKLIGQTQPGDTRKIEFEEWRNQGIAGIGESGEYPMPPKRQTFRVMHLGLMDIGAVVRIWVDQVWHIAVIALVALVVA